MFLFTWFRPTEIWLAVEEACSHSGPNVFYVLCMCPNIGVMDSARRGDSLGRFSTGVGAKRAGLAIHAVELVHSSCSGERGALWPWVLKGSCPTTGFGNLVHMGVFFTIMSVNIQISELEGEMKLQKHGHKPNLLNKPYYAFFFIESFTADHKPLLGESPEVRGFFLGCGFNSAGKW